MSSSPSSPPVSKLWIMVICMALATVVFLGLLAAFMLSRTVFFRSPPVLYNTSTVLRQVQTLSQWVTVKFVLEKVVILEDPPKTTLGQMFTGDNRVILVAHGVVKAGVNFDKLQPSDIRVKGTNIMVHLPPAEITDAYLDDKQTQVIEHKTGLMRQFDKDLEQNARRQAIDDIRRAARTDGIIKEADDRAREQLRLFFNRTGLGVQFIDPI